MASMKEVNNAGSLDVSELSLHEPPKTWLLLSQRMLLRMNDIASIDIFSFFFSFFFFDKCQLFYTLESQHSFVFKTMQCSTSQSIMKQSSVLRAFIKTQIAISEIFAEFIITRKLKRATNASHKHSIFSFSRSFSPFFAPSNFLLVCRDTCLR